jgi:hypothetical protein
MTFVPAIRLYLGLLWLANGAVKLWGETLDALLRGRR